MPKSPHFSGLKIPVTILLTSISTFAMLFVFSVLTKDFFCDNSLQFLKKPRRFAATGPTTLSSTSVINQSDWEYRLFDCSPNQNAGSIIYNRMPKCGSSTILQVMRRLSRSGKFHFVQNSFFCQKSFNAVGMRNAHEYISFIDMEAKKRKSRHLFAEVHMHFFDMNLELMVTSLPLPIKYIQIIRHPLSLLLSFFYYDLYQRKEYSELLLRRTSYIMNNGRTQANTTGDATFIEFDACVEAADQGNASALPIWCSVPLTLVPWFCGHQGVCLDGHSPLAMSRAIENYHKYHFVGLVEEMEASVAILERTLPQYFEGATKLLTAEGGLRANDQRLSGYREYVAAAMNDGRLEQVKQRLQPDIELYEYIRVDFQRRKSACQMLDKFQHSS